jgi:hypothetical protein
MELEELIEDVPVWQLTKTSVTLLTTFESRITTIRPRLDRLKRILQTKTPATR